MPAIVITVYSISVSQNNMFPEVYQFQSGPN